MCKLVIIDDNPTDHYIMQRLLHKNYYCEQVTYTYDGQLVLDFLEQHKETGSLPDVIFLDLDMPRFSGWEFLDELEAFNRNATKKVQVHIMSSSIRSADVFRSKKYNSVNSFITKPLSRDLVNKICEEATPGSNRHSDVA